MAGHSKWANIKHRKGAQDKKKGILFSKCSKAIMAAVKQGGPDPDMNLTLTYAIEKARASNMPRDRIERAIQSAAGTGQADAYSEVMYEGYAPGGVAVMVECLTDNRHRTAPEMKKIFERVGGNLGSTGSVAHGFRRSALFVIDKPQATEDQLMEIALNAGADDVHLEEDAWEVVGAPETFSKIRAALKAGNIEPKSSSIAFLPTMKVEVSSEADAAQILKLMETLEDHDDVSNVYTNFDIPEAILERVAANSDT